MEDKQYLAENNITNYTATTSKLTDVRDSYNKTSPSFNGIRTE